MGVEFWPVITTGIVILIAIAASNRAMRREMNERTAELGGRVTEVQQELGGRVTDVQQDLGEMRREMSERLGDVRERLGRVEGLLEGIGLTRRLSDGKGRGAALP